MILLACSSPPELEIQVSEEIGTLVTVSWQREESTEARIFYGDSLVTPTQTSPIHRFTLYGLPAGTESSLTIEEDGKEVLTASVTTDPLPEEIPVFTLIEGETEGFILTSYSDLKGERCGLLIVDSQARIVWYTTTPPYTSAVQWDGHGFWYNLNNVPHTAQYISLNGKAGEAVELPGGHHDFLVEEDRLVWLAEDISEVEGEMVIGDRLLAGDPENPMLLWSAFDTMEIVEHPAWDNRQEGGDWTHANGIAATDAGYLVSLLWLQTILEVADNQILRKLEGVGPQHAPRPTEKGVLFFDNEGGTNSRIRETSWEGQELFAWGEGEGTAVLGDVEDHGEFLLSAWGESGRLIWIDREQGKRWEAQTEGVILGQASWRADLNP
jgi:hypothetical protein